GGLGIALRPGGGADALAGGESPHNGIAALDIDNDRDLDVILAIDAAPPRAILNDRLGEFRDVELKGLSAPGPSSGLLVTDFDADGRPDLVAAGAEGGVLAWRNTTDRTPAVTRLTFETWPIDATRWRSAQAVDLDLDGWPDLLGLPAATRRPGELILPSWARNDGKRSSTEALSLGLESSGLDG